MMSIEPKSSRAWRWIAPVAAIAVIALAAFAILDRLERDAGAAARRSLLARADALTASALQPGSALGCLDSQAGEATEGACEANVFATPQATAAAIVYIGARLALLADAQRLGQATAMAFAGSRRALELDRFGIAAHVLAVRDSCTPERCAAFAFLTDTGVLKGNMKAQAFDQYVSRHMDAWNAPAPATAPPPAVSQAQPAPAPEARAASIAPADGVRHPIPNKYTLPSADSIPAVSIMDKEPPLPKGAADAQVAAPKSDAKTEPKAQPESALPVPPKRPQAQSQQAAPAPAR
jgi:hypothetical protein